MDMKNYVCGRERARDHLLREREITNRERASNRERESDNRETDNAKERQRKKRAHVYTPHQAN